MSSCWASQITALRFSAVVPLDTGPASQGRRDAGERRRRRPRRGRTAALGWSCRKLAATVGGDLAFDGAWRRSAALCFAERQQARSARASRIVPTPIVIARRGTFSSPKKSLAASRRVTRSSVIRRVRLSRRGAGLVEADVAGAADAQDLHVDAAGVVRSPVRTPRSRPATSSLGERAVGDVDVVGRMSMWSKRCSCMKRT